VAQNIDGLALICQSTPWETASARFLFARPSRRAFFLCGRVRVPTAYRAVKPV